MDAMGGDNAPVAIVKGCVDAVKSEKGYDITLIGDENQINNILKKEKYDKNRISVQHASDVILNEDSPTSAVKNKKDSSMVVGFNMLKESKGDAFLSAGNSGALLTGSLFYVGRMKGVIRPALGAVIPTKEGETLLIDAGLNSVVKPENYVQFAKFGTEYMKALYGIKNPSVGLVNIGVEDSKGTPKVKEANELLKESNVNYIGNVEGNDVIDGKARIVVCDGFIGNILLKFLEGMGSYFMKGIRKVIFKTPFTKLGGLLLKEDMKNFFKSMDPDLVGGAPILGVNKLVMKTHGSSQALTIKNVLSKTAMLLRENVTGRIRVSLEEENND